jgi:endonuclease/exonuclease/phosphatase family metal-dependent hydrolase
MRIVTLNTWKNEGDYRRRLVAMITGLRAISPDIVLLQESFRTLDGEADTARTLGEALGLKFHYAPARAKLRRWRDRDVPTESGLAILTRGSITWSERLALPSDERGGERIALLAAILIDETPVVAGCMHLSHVRGDHAGRRAQLAAILAHLIWTVPAALRVLGGDTNATLDSPTLDWFSEHPSLSIQSAVAETDAQPTHPLPPRIDRPGRMIDHVFTVGPRADILPPLKNSSIVFTSAPNGIFASDHAAVVADFVTAACALPLGPS